MRLKASRWRYLLPVLTVGLLLVLGLLLLPGPTRITVKHFQQLRVGMTVAEVETLFGGPPRNEVAPEAEDDLFDDQLEFAVGTGANEPPGTRTLTWRSTELKAMLCFSREGRLVYGYANRVCRFGPDPWWQEWPRRLREWWRS